MKIIDVTLAVNTTGKGDYTAHMTAYIPSNGLDLKINSNRPAVVIFPGGGYSITYDGEAEPIALKFTAEGAAAFVVWYSVVSDCKEKIARYPQALIEGLTAIKYVRDHAVEYGINPNNIAALGFSAGGHLCACTGTLWNRPELAEYLPAPRAEYRPDKLILCYPVIKSSGAHHQGSFDCLLGKPEEGLQTPEQMKLLSLEKQVRADTPPTFLWHTFSDSAVPVQGSLEFALALADYKVPCEMHLYPHGEHGLCLASHVTSDMFSADHPFYAAEWIDHAVSFLFDESLLPPKK